MELRDDSAFCDVTLACDGRRVEAHKVILSSCSPVIKDLLIQSQHPHPILYLRGVKFSQITALLDFIYKGEVDLAREELDDFLEVARELQVKGLTEEDRQSREFEQNPKAIEHEVLGFTANDDDQKKEKIKPAFPTLFTEEDENEKEETYFEPIEEANFIPQIKMEEEDYFDREDESCDTSAPFPEYKVIYRDKVYFNCEQCDYKTTRKVNLTEHEESIHKGILHACDQCDFKIGRKDSLKRHIKSVHQGVIYSCELCEFKTAQKGNLNRHMKKVHEKMETGYLLYGQ